jgi:hypothetical protein
MTTPKNRPKNCGEFLIMIAPHTSHASRVYKLVWALEVYQPCATLVLRNDYELFTLLLQRVWSGVK